MTTANSSRIFALAILLLLSAVDVTAQTSATDGKTPSGLTPGAPAGTYPLTDIENINLFNGNLNFALPLLKVGGRGKAQYTMMLPIEQHWRTFSGAFDLGGGNLLYYSAPEANWWTGLKPGYGPGVVQARQVADGPLTCAGTEFYSTGMTRLTVCFCRGKVGRARLLRDLRTSPAGITMGSSTTVPTNVAGMEPF